MPEWLIPAASGLLAFAGAWGGIKVHLHYMTRDIRYAVHSARAAHYRLDRIGAPPMVLDAERGD